MNSLEYIKKFGLKYYDLNKTKHDLGEIGLLLQRDSKNNDLTESFKNQLKEEQRILQKHLEHLKGGK